MKEIKSSFLKKEPDLLKPGSGLSRCGHLHCAYYLCINSAHWININWTYHKHIEWIVIVTVGLRYETVISRIMNWRKQNSVTFTEPMQFIINASEVLGSSKKIQEVGFDLLCRSVPRTDKSCNQIDFYLISKVLG